MIVPDHLVYAVSDLWAAADRLERALGVRPTAGGHHLGRGTMNLLAALGDGAYLEVIGPDPEQQEPAGGRSFGITAGMAPRLLTWAARSTDIDATVAAARRAGWDPGPVVAMQRATPQGDVLSWRLTMPRDRLAHGGIVPFFIDWGATPHPATTSATGLRLVALRAAHPQPEQVAPALAALGVRIEIEPGPVAGLIAEIAGPSGSLRLAP